MSTLFKSRKFLLLLLDTLCSAIALVGGWYLVPTQLDKVTAIVALVQPVFVAVIVGITIEDAAAYKAGVHPNQTVRYK